MTNQAWAQPVYERRRRRRRILDPISITVFSISALLALATMLFVLGPVDFAIAAVAALLPVPIYLTCVLLIDRFHPEPTANLAWAFFAGASVVILGALAANTGIGVINLLLFGQSIGNILTLSATAPFVEETLKGAVLVFIFWRERHRFNGKLDGVVYAAMVGLGFATVENIQYYGNGLATEGGFVATVIARGVFSPFAHPMFTAMTGIGIAIAANSRGTKRWVAPLVGLAAAMFLHALWNGSTQVGDGIGFLLVIPLFFTVLLVIGVVALLDASRRKANSSKTLGVRGVERPSKSI